MKFEACDDNNTNNFDGCNDSGEIEPGFTCSGMPSRCLKCGNGLLFTDEGCDDGNLVNGDGCSSTC